MAIVKRAKKAEVEEPIEQEVEAEQEVAAKPRREPRPPRWFPESVITLTVDYNPKRVTSKAYGVFALYKDGMTVAEFQEAAGDMAAIALNWDTDHNFIVIGDELQDIEKQSKPEAKPRKARKVKATNGEDTGEGEGDDPDKDEDDYEEAVATRAPVRAPLKAPARRSARK